MQLYVPIASVATLRLLWLVQIAKGAFSLQWPLRLMRDQRVELALGIGGERIRFAAEVRTCTPATSGFHIDLRLAPLSDVTRRALEAALSAAPDSAHH